MTTERIETLNDAANDVLARMHCRACPATDDTCADCALLIGKVIKAASAAALSPLSIKEDGK